MVGSSNFWSQEHGPDFDVSIVSEGASRQQDISVVRTSTIRNLRHRQFIPCGWTDEDPTSGLSAGSNDTTAFRPRRPRLRIVKGQQSIWGQPRTNDVGNAAAAAYMEAEPTPPTVSYDQVSTEDPHLRVSKSSSEDLPPASAKSPLTIEIDRLLQSNDEETQNVGLQKAREQQSKIQITLLLVCYQKGICEPVILQKMVDFFRVRFIVSYSNAHYCELCNVLVQTTLLGSHLQYGHHCSLLASLAKGDTVLVNHEAIAMGSQRDESASVSLSRFRDGLGIHGRFCSPLDCKLAKNLRQLGTLEFPQAFVKEMLPLHRSLWITPAEYNKMNDEYQQRKKRLDKGSRGPFLGSLALPLASQHAMLSTNHHNSHLSNGLRGPCQENSVQGILPDTTQQPSVGIHRPAVRTHQARVRIPHRDVSVRIPNRDLYNPLSTLAAEEEFKKCCLGMARRGEDSPSHRRMTGNSFGPAHSSYRLDDGT